MNPFIEMKLNPVWDEIEPVRNKTSEFLRTHKVAEATVYALTMVVSELVENAIKYGNFPNKGDKVAVSLKIENKAVIIEVQNPVDEKALKNLRNLDRAIQWIRGYQDPFEAYVIKLKEVSKKSFRDETSGLGLVRIAYEGRAILDFFLRDDGVVNVSAVSSL
ncbi:MAG: ATP-binding protein [Thermodesulfobacteriota bacterium]